jgi:glycosyltransferase involved in cell wall biosynthesis
VVVSDDASVDGTVERLRAIQDPRLRIAVSPKNLGQNQNRNRTIALARGPLLKFLDDDDVLREDCVAKMVEVAAQDAEIGFVFSAREILGLEQGEDFPEEFVELHTSYAQLAEVNDGRELLAEWMAANLRGNWIGEPSTVLVRRSHLAKAGGFSRHVTQIIDAELWIRLMKCSRVGFVNEPLVQYRVGHTSVTKVNMRSRSHWLDRLWMFEGLVRDASLVETHPQVCDWLQAERRQAWRTAARLGRPPDGARVPIRPYLTYAAHRFASRIGRPRPLYGAVEPTVS